MKIVKAAFLACGIVLVALWLAGGVVAGRGHQRNSAAGRIGQDALWQPGMHFLQDVHAACDGTGAKFGDCLTTQMAKSGAPAAAIAFTKATGDQGIMRDFREAGPVAIAYAVYLYRANENEVWLVVNGDPAMIDVDDYNLFPRAALEKNAEFLKIKKKYPKAEVFPGDRAGTKGPVVTELPNRGMRIAVEYKLNDQCHACAQVGTVEAGFEFEKSGKLDGVKLLGVTPKPGLT
jgi:hypothetical protein